MAGAICDQMCSGIEAGRVVNWYQEKISQSNINYLILFYLGHLPHISGAIS